VEDDETETYRKMGEAYQIPPWRIPLEITTPQMFGFYLGEGDPQTVYEATERANRRRERKGLPLLPLPAPPRPD
jgi:hypothetical protein